MTSCGENFTLVLHKFCVMWIFCSFSLSPSFQIGGPRGEKGQKGEPAIIEPVRISGGGGGGGCNGGECVCVCVQCVKVLLVLVKC